MPGYADKPSEKGSLRFRVFETDRLLGEKPKNRQRQFPCSVHNAGYHPIYARFALQSVHVYFLTHFMCSNAGELPAPIIQLQPTSTVVQAYRPEFRQSRISSSICSSLCRLNQRRNRDLLGEKQHTGTSSWWRTKDRPFFISHLYTMQRSSFI